MKTLKVYEHKAIRLKRKSRSRIIQTGLTFALAFGVGAYIGSTTPWAEAETVTTDTAVIHIVAEGETVWDIARPVADQNGQDIREVIYEILVNNNLGPDPTLKPGQRLIIRQDF